MTENYLGIDFGTCNSSMAWLNPKTGHAETLLNAEGEDKTPSVVYYGDKETLVGKFAEERMERSSECKRIVRAAKRELAKAHVWMMGTRPVTPVDATAEILKKLKRDAEETHFHAPVNNAVITFPAVFDETEKDKLREAAARAGFTKVELLEEPVAAAIAYVQAGINVGQNVLVYDLGGGTFDLAMLAREDGAFRLAMEPRGDRIGGEDFDRSIYTHFDDVARKNFGQPICEEGIDPHLLRQCRRFKENLSVSEKPHPLSWWWKGKGQLELKLTRRAFDEMIRDPVDRTVQLALLLSKEAARVGHTADSVILIGGSSRIPLVQRRLHEALHVEPRKWQKQDVAVALGAACHANILWGNAATQPVFSVPASREDAPALQAWWLDHVLPEQNAELPAVIPAPEIPAQVPKEVRPQVPHQNLPPYEPESSPSSDIHTPSKRQKKKKNARAGEHVKPPAPAATYSGSVSGPPNGAFHPVVALLIALSIEIVCLLVCIPFRSVPAFVFIVPLGFWLLQNNKRWRARHGSK